MSRQDNVARMLINVLVVYLPLQIVMFLSTLWENTIMFLILTEVASKVIIRSSDPVKSARWLLKVLQDQTKVRVLWLCIPLVYFYSLLAISSGADVFSCEIKLFSANFKIRNDSRVVLLLIDTLSWHGKVCRNWTL